MKNILVTGCSRGIGFETVKSFAKIHKANVIAVARNKDGLTKLEKECYEINSEFQLHVLELDLAEKKSTDTVFNYIKKNMNNSLDGIIHNAGFLVKKSFKDITYDELEKSFKINLFSPFKIALYDSDATLGASTTAFTTSEEITNTSGTAYTSGGATLTSVTPVASSTTAICVSGTLGIFIPLSTAPQKLLSKVESNSASVCV